MISVNRNEYGKDIYFQADNFAVVEAINAEARKESGLFSKAPSVWLLDGSTPRANFRMVESLTTAWAGLQFQCQDVLTSMSLSGWKEEAQEWGLELGSEDQVQRLAKKYFDVFSLRIKDIHQIDTEAYYRDSLPIKFYNESDIVVGKRQDRLAQVSQVFGLEKAPKVVEFNQLVSEIHLREFEVPQLERSSIGYFKCPCKQCFENQIHNIKRVNGQWLVVRRMPVTKGVPHDRVMKCKGAGSMRELLNEKNMTLGDLFERVGFVLSGKAAFMALAAVDSVSGVALRDYSNPRGVFDFAKGLFGNRLAISSRIYCKNPDGSDCGFEAMGLLNEQAVEEIKNVFESVPIISDGRTVDITLAPLIE